MDAINWMSRIQFGETRPIWQKSSDFLMAMGAASSAPTTGGRGGRRDASGTAPLHDTRRGNAEPGQLINIIVV
jgi:hypothetical protein